jgi:cell division protein FtsB
MGRRQFAKISIFLAVAVLLAGYFAYKKYTARRETQKVQVEQEAEQKAVLENIAEDNPEEKAENKSLNTAKQTEGQASSNLTEIPKKYLLEIPFYSQAPFANWDAFHEDMCEEASLLNAAYFLLGKKPGKDEYEAELQKMKKFEEKLLGEWKSTTIAQIKKLVDTYFEGEVKNKIIESPTVEQIEAEISQNHPVIVPLAGRDIGNPNYRQPGPIYHMLVVKGYDEKFFITNDVGTRKGDSYVYKKEVIMQNMHDWEGKDIHLGGKRVLVLYK